MLNHFVIIIKLDIVRKHAAKPVLLLHSCEQPVPLAHGSRLGPPITFWAVGKRKLLENFLPVKSLLTNNFHPKMQYLG